MKNFYVLSVIFVLLLVVSGIFWLYFQTLQTEDSQVQKESSDTEAIVSDTTNWKTYRNEEYGFEFQYPKKWLVRKEACGSFQSEIDRSLSDTCSGELLTFYVESKDDFYYDDIVKVFIAYYDGETNSSDFLKPLRNSDDEYTNISRFGEEVIDGESISYVVTAGMTSWHYYAFPSKTKEAIISFDYEFSARHYNPEIISTIKLIEPQATSD